MEVTPKPASSAGWIMPLLVVVAVVVLASGKDDDEDFQFSDVRLKEDICRVFTNHLKPGVCRYCYRGPAAIHEGVMAYKVEVMHPSAVRTMPFGYKAVDYAKLGLEIRGVASAAGYRFKSKTARGGIHAPFP